MSNRSKGDCQRLETASLLLGHRKRQTAIIDTSDRSAFFQRALAHMQSRCDVPANASASWAARRARQRICWAQRKRDAVWAVFFIPPFRVVPARSATQGEGCARVSANAADHWHDWTVFHSDHVCRPASSATGFWRDCQQSCAAYRALPGSDHGDQVVRSARWPAQSIVTRTSGRGCMERCTCRVIKVNLASAFPVSDDRHPQSDWFHDRLSELAVGKPGSSQALRLSA